VFSYTSRVGDRALNPKVGAVARVDGGPFPRGTLCKDKIWRRMEAWRGEYMAATI
jgi:hypothetical protein